MGNHSRADPVALHLVARSRKRSQSATRCADVRMFGCAPILTNSSNCMVFPQIARELSGFAQKPSTSCLPSVVITRSRKRSYSARLCICGYVLFGPFKTLSDQCINDAQETLEDLFLIQAWSRGGILVDTVCFLRERSHSDELQMQYQVRPRMTTKPSRSVIVLALLSRGPDFG